MRGKNSERDELIRRDLLGMSVQLCSQNDPTGLGPALRGFLPTLDRAFILKWLPEQADDIYWVLVDPTTITKVEIPRAREEPAVLEAIDPAMFRGKPQSRKVREKLEIALKLMSG